MTGILEFWPHKSLVRGFFHCLRAVPQVSLDKAQDLICFRCDSFDMCVIYVGMRQIIPICRNATMLKALMVKVKSAFEPSGPSGWSLSLFQ